MKTRHSKFSIALSRLFTQMSELNLNKPFKFRAGHFFDPSSLIGHNW